MQMYLPFDLQIVQFLSIRAKHMLIKINRSNCHTGLQYMHMHNTHIIQKHCAGQYSTCTIHSYRHKTQL